ncbi:hypothetical protein LPJ75_004036 [Coemansia sp. RSA 2598]|nr:hypothetical protein LPJ75_004036 [Coemansia sp. RSA 2598]
MIEGPYAFVYLDKKQEKLWFSRDFLGRRSLLIRHWDTQTLFLSSVAGSNDDEYKDERGGAGWEELPAQRVFCLDLRCESLPFSYSSCIATYHWAYRDQVPPVTAEAFQPTIPFGQVVLDQQQTPSDPELRLEDGFPTTSDEWRPYVDGLQAVLSQSIRQRVESIPIQDNDPSAPRVGILFSGGVDCITIAALLTQMLPQTEPIELFNVSFENPRQTKAHGASSSKYNVPDRLTGIQGWRELCRIDPLREWRFVQVDVPYSQVLEYRSHIRRLLVPSDTVMDMSIGMAIWFAARGIGNAVSDTGAETPYTGKAKVLLLGMGADEQLGGYSRHRSAWDRGGIEALGLEIRLDVQRIATRNLGRDDRVVSDTSKEARYPFLAAAVVDYLSTVPIGRKMDMRLPRGIGEKLLLRMLARRLGLMQASVLAKRAIQFGARTAKMESSNTKGQDSL